MLYKLRHMCIAVLLNYYCTHRTTCSTVRLSLLGTCPMPHPNISFTTCQGLLFKYGTSCALNGIFERLFHFTRSHQWSDSFLNAYLIILCQKDFSQTHKYIFGFTNLHILQELLINSNYLIFYLRTCL